MAHACYQYSALFYHIVRQWNLSERSVVAAGPHNSSENKSHLDLTFACLPCFFGAKRLLYAILDHA